MGCKNVHEMAGKKEKPLLYKRVEETNELVEDLDIERNWKYLTLHALRKYRGAKEASRHLGVSERTVFRLIQRWELDWKCPNLNSNE